MRRWVFAAVAALMTGCANQQQSAAPATPTPVPVPASNSRMVLSPDGEVHGEIVGTPAPRSKFARLRIGMPQKQVEDLIGPPNDMDAHITGKSFIPFYFGGDTHRQEAFYRGEGILTYAPSHFGGMANRLIRIIVDTSEQGYSH